ncbi:hypothetical protein TcasGA2_TC034614 [Tribolium castaneum]|uniref:Uncharacterized protein n=1 Tax=Tribolium castaneum TaxID=7070 RepID=A0A139WKD6_TRICA|nr:hypothetical protein TcasGA2_TC034614 [Tribolium castaneum]
MQVLGFNKASLLKTTLRRCTSLYRLVFDVFQREI